MRHDQLHQREVSLAQREVSPSVAKLGFLVAKLREVMRSYSEGENPSRAVRAIPREFMVVAELPSGFMSLRESRVKRTIVTNL